MGLDEHVRVGDHSRLAVRWTKPRQPEEPDRRPTSPVPSATPTRKPYRLSEAGLRALRISGAKTGKAVAALNNSRRRRCDGCGMVTTPAALGAHQKHSGHTGWTEVRAA